MALETGRSANTNDTATVSAAIALNSTTSTVIAAANPNRLFFRIDNNANVMATWIKLQPAASDNDQKGIFLQSSPLTSVTFWEMPPDNIYIGEISAIADAGSPVIYVTEY